MKVVRWHTCLVTQHLPGKCLKTAGKSPCEQFKNCELPYDLHSNTATIGLLHHRTHTLASEAYRRLLRKHTSMGKVSTGWHGELLLVIRQSRFFQSLVAWAYRQGRQRSLGLVHDDDIRMPHRGWRYRQALRCMWRRPSLFAGRCSLVCCSRDHGQGR